ncbi:MAG: Hint domain-containing protein [Sedimentisphaerales bacterium]|nr:Hint domain-containing protein [Sedimentisphaerales bacterium]
MVYFPDGSVQFIKDAAGQTGFAYNGLGQNTTTTDADGNIDVIDYNSLGWMLRQKHGTNGPTPGIIEYPEHEADGAIKREIPPDGVARTFVRDAKGLVREFTFPKDGGNVTEKYEYTNSGLTIKVEDGKTNVWRVTRDYLGRVYEEQVPRLDNGQQTEQITQTKLNARGLSTEETIATGENDQYNQEIIEKRNTEYNANGWATVVKNDTLEQHFNHDNNGQMTHMWVGQEGSLDAARAAGVVVEFQYNESRRMTQEIDQLGQTWGRDYDAAGRMTESKDPANRKTTIDYDNVGRPVKITDPRGCTIENVYSAAGQVLATKDKNGRWSYFKHDERGRLTESKDAAGNTVAYEYEDSPPRVTVTDPDGGKVRRTLNTLGNIVTEERWTGTAWQLAYSAAYDERGLMTSMTNGRNQTITVQYDNQGRMIHKNYPGNVTVDFSWARDGQLLGMSGGGTNLGYRYDQQRRLVGVSDGTLGRGITYEYDQVRGRKTAMLFSGEAIRYGYNNADRLTSVSRDGGPQATLAYDTAGRLGAVNLPNGIVSTYGYDAASRLTSVSHSRNGQVVASAQYLLDNMGNRVRETHHDGSYTQYGYDTAARVNYEHYHGATDEWRTYAYTAGGDRTMEKRLAAIAWTNSWLDEFNREELGSNYVVEGGEWELVDPDDDDDYQLLRKTEGLQDPEQASGPAVVTNSANTFSGFIEVSGEVEPLAGTQAKPLTSALVFAYTDDNEYWLAGAKTWKAIPEGEQEERLHVLYFIAHNDNGEFKVLEESAEPEILAVGTSKIKLKLRMVPLALNLLVQDSQNNWVEKITTRSPWDGVIATVPQSRVGFYSDRESPEPAAGKFDNLKVEWAASGLSVETASFEYAADKLHQLVRVRGMGKDADYTYDADGNLASELKNEVLTAFEYNFENRLQTVRRGGNVIRQYAYQGDTWMQRTVQEDNGQGLVPTHMLYDGANLLAEYDAQMNLAAYHVTNGLDKTLWTVRGGSLQTPLYGAHNVIAVADTGGAVTARYRYTAFGERFDLVGNAPAPRDPSFQGRTYDAGLGFYDHRNRQFDPKTGRFLQRDPVDGDPLMNPYAYPTNNPVNFLDPMGTGNGQYRQAKQSVDTAHTNRRTVEGLLKVNSAAKIGQGVAAEWFEESWKRIENSHTVYQTSRNKAEIDFNAYWKTIWFWVGSDDEALSGSFFGLPISFPGIKVARETLQQAMKNSRELSKQTERVANNADTAVKVLETADKVVTVASIATGYGGIARVGAKILLQEGVKQFGKYALQQGVRYAVTEGVSRGVGYAQEAAIDFAVEQEWLSVEQAETYSSTFDRFRQVAGVVAMARGAAAQRGTAPQRTRPQGPTPRPNPAPASQARAGACFVAGTLIATPDGLKPIEDIKVGDLVLAADPETGENGAYRVAQTFKRDATALIDIEVGNKRITCTPEHPFWVPICGWVEAAKLQVGDSLCDVDGRELHVDRIAQRETTASVFNIEVERVHTYYVTTLRVLVHNQCKAGGTPAGGRNPNGRKGGPAHQAKVNEVIADIESRGLLAAQEFRVKTVGGAKPVRYMDVVAIDPQTRRVVEAHQIGRGWKSNPSVPVAREQAAFRDVRHSPVLHGARRIFHNYE